MERTYLRIKPSRESLNPDEIVRNVASFHKLHETSGGLLKSDTHAPTFEFLAVSEGSDEPVKFYLGVADRYLDAIETDLETLYPNSFDIEREQLDLQDVLVPRLKYNENEYYADFGGQIEDWDTATGAITPSSIGDPDSQELRVKDTDEATLDLPGNPEPVSDEDDTYVLATPDIDDVTPVIVEWRGDGDRKKDWMTTIKRFTDLRDPDNDDLDNRSPLARLIQQLAKTELPCAYQVLFERKKPWPKAAEKRRRNIHLTRDTTKQKLQYELGELIHPRSRERRKERRRDYFEKEGESADRKESSDIGDIGGRKQLIDDKHPKRTFKVNIRAACVATRRVPEHQARREMEQLKHVFDHLDGQFYGFDATILDTDPGMLDETDPATATFEQMVNRTVEVSPENQKTRRNLVLNADELSNFIIAPSSRGLTVEGTRETRATPETRNPLPRPDPDIMEQFHTPGMRIGFALDEDAQPDDEPTQVPPSVLPTHYGRFAATGGGKSKAILNDMLSLYENTDGPTILIDPKGDNMAENYIQSHWARHGNVDDIYYFPVPDILPGFSFFNLNPSLQNGKRRVDAVQNKAQQYEEIIKLVMGKEAYGQSMVAPNVIKALIRACFDPETGTENGIDREDPNYFSHHDLEQVARQLRDAANQESMEGIPAVSDDRLHEMLARHLQSSETDFAQIMDAVFNRLDFIKSDVHLRRIFDNTQPKFDFRELIHDDAVILFDLGDLRDEPSLLMTGLILTNLWDALEEGKREDWPANHVVNLIIDEASSVAVSDIMNKMLEKGRGFGLSVGLAMQFPEQMRAVSETAYMNVMNNVGSKLIGKIPHDREIAEAMAHESMDPDEFSNRMKALPRGEWIAKLPSPSFQETGPEPFSLDPMPIPAGHPESDNPLAKPERKKFQQALLPQITTRTAEQLGVTIPDSHTDSPNAPTGGSDQSPPTTADNATSTAPDATGPDTGATGSDDTTDTTPPDGFAASSLDTDDDATPAPAATPADASDDTETTSSPTAVPETFTGDETTDADEFPDRIKVQQHVLICTACGREYPRQKREKAIGCCGDPADAPSNSATESDTATTDTAPASPDTPATTAETSTESTAPRDTTQPTQTNTNPDTDTDTGADETSGPSNNYNQAVADSVFATDEDEDEDKDEATASETAADTDEEGSSPTTPPSPGGHGRTRGSDSTTPTGTGTAILDITTPETPPDDVPAAPDDNDWQQEAEALVDEWTPEDIEYAAASIVQSDRNDNHRDSLLRGLCVRARKRGYDLSFGTIYNAIDDLADITVPPRYRTATTTPDTPTADPDTDDTPTETATTEADTTTETEADASAAEDAADTDADEPADDAAYCYDPLTDSEFLHPVDAPGSPAQQVTDAAPRVAPPDDAGYTEFGLDDEAAAFLTTLIHAVNGDLDYHLHQPMTPLKDQFDIADFEQLKAENFVHEHWIGTRGQWYTPTSRAEKAVNVSLDTAPGAGVAGEGTPHRVAVFITALYFQHHPAVATVQPYYPVTESKDLTVDLVLFDAEDDPIATVAVETTGSVTDPTPATAQGRDVSNPTDAITTAFDRHAALPGTSLWVIAGRSVAGTIIDTLAETERIPAVTTSDESFEALRTELPADADSGLTTLHSLSELWNAWEDLRFAPDDLFHDP